MSDYQANADRGKFFTLYFKENDVTINLSRKELVDLIRETVTLLELSGEKHIFYKNESVKGKFVNIH